MPAFIWIKTMQILVLVLGVCTSSVAQAGINQWTSSGPVGQNIRALTLNPQTPAILYTGTDGGCSKPPTVGQAGI